MSELRSRLRATRIARLGARVFLADPDTTEPIERTERGAIPPPLRYAIIKAYDRQCQYCSEKGADVIDHIVPLAKGGADIIENLTLACETCNAKKSDNPLLATHGAILLAKAARYASRIRNEAQQVSQARRPSVIGPRSNPGLCDMRMIAPISVALLKQVEDFRFAERLRSKSEAARALIEAGLRAVSEHEIAADPPGPLTAQLIFPASASLIENVNNYFFERRLRSKSEAIRQLISAGLASQN